MKKFATLILLIVLANGVYAQKYCKKAIVHAYQRNSMPGNFPQRETSEDGKIQRPVKPVVSYHIYMEEPVQWLIISSATR